MPKQFAKNKLLLGSRSIWLVLRIGPGIMFVLLVLFIPPQLLHPAVFHTEGMDFLIFLGIFGALIFGGFVEAHQVVYGFTDEGGIHYQRYFRWRYINWGEIESITRQPMGAILVDVEGYNFFNRHLFFMKDTVLFGDRPKSVSFDDLRSLWIRARQFPGGPPSGNSLILG